MKWKDRERFSYVHTTQVHKKLYLLGFRKSKSRQNVLKIRIAKGLICLPTIYLPFELSFVADVKDFC